MHAIVGKRSCIHDFHGPRINLRLDAERAQQAQVVAEKIRDGLRREWYGPRNALGSTHNEKMIDEIEFDLEAPVVPGNWRSAKSARGEIESYLPPMVLHRCECQPRLTDDLRPSVKRLVGLEPFVEW
jgi:hypothetical protein